MVVAWTVLAMLIQMACLLLPGRAKVRFARTYWAGFSRVLGVRVRVIGAAPPPGRSVLYVSNHSSWVDIPVLGGVLPGCFVSRGDLADWPVISTVARLGRTIFVSRQRNATARELEQMHAVLDRGDSIILFPEGTTSDGSRVMPFRTSFFAVAFGEHPPLVQPVSMTYDRLGGLPIGRLTRTLFAWYGDQDIASHYWQLFQHKGMRATVLLHQPIDPSQFQDRKALSNAVWRVIADGAAMLRQNRPAEPIAVAPTQAGQTERSRPATA